MTLVGGWEHDQPFFVKIIFLIERTTLRSMPNNIRFYSRKIGRYFKKQKYLECQMSFSLSISR